MGLSSARNTGAADAAKLASRKIRIHGEGMRRQVMNERRQQPRDDESVWTDEDRDYYRRHGISRTEHAQHHQWLTQKVQKEKFWAELWRSLVRDNAKRAISAVFWFAMLALALGFTGAWEYAVKILLPE